MATQSVYSPRVGAISGRDGLIGLGPRFRRVTSPSDGEIPWERTARESKKGTAGVSASPLGRTLKQYNDAIKH